MYQGAAGLLRDIEQDVYSEDVPEGLESPMKHHAFSPRAAAAAGMVVLLVGGTATGAMAAATSASASSARQATATAPGAPTGLTAAPGNGTATLSWSPPGSDGGSPVDFYVIEGGTSPSDDGILDKTGGHTATLSGLTNGTAYYFSVHAQNAFGDGASATVTVTPQGSGSVTGSGSRPGSPTGLKTSYGDGFIALSWSPPRSAGSSPRHRLPRVHGIQLVVRGRQGVHHLGPEFPAHRRGKRQPVLHQGHRAQRSRRRARDPRDVGHP